MQQMIDAVLAETSPAELEYIRGGDWLTAKWLVKKVLADLTDSQAETVAIRLTEQVSGCEA